MTIRAILGTTAIMGSLIPLSATALAQDAVPSTKPETFDGPEVVVTGSRIIRDGSGAPTPLTVIGSDFLAKRNIINVADALNELPAFRGSTSPATTANASRNPGANYVNLRNLGVNRTLTLIDGVRHVPTSDTGQLDLNFIPSLMIDRVDVVTGGTSAVYGSDAVAGVVNLVLKKRFNGVRTQADFGVSERGDNLEYRASLLAGTSFADTRGWVTLSVDYMRSTGIGDAYTRDWGRQEYGLVTNATGASPSRLIAANVHPATMAPNGIITAGPLSGTTFSADGTPTRFNYGQLASGSTMIGGDGYGNTLFRGYGLMPKLERRIAYLRTGYELSDSVEISADLSYGWTRGISTTPYYFNQGNLTIQRGNPFLPGSVASDMDAARITSFRFGRLWTDIGQAFGVSTTDALRGVVALKGKLGSDWNWTADVQYGRSKYHQTVENGFLTARVNEAIDAVYAPDGSIVCRVALTDPTTACRPFNPFGTGRNAADVKNYFTGTQDLRQIQKEISASVGMSGKLFDIGAGDIGIAFGAEYRRESLDAVADPLSNAGLYSFGNPRTVSGAFDVKEAFVEIDAPLLADLPLIHALSFNGAYRYADYSTSGGTSMWKLGLTWDITPDLRLRGTRSRDVRAPNIPELFVPFRNNGSFTIFDKTRNNASSVVLAFLQGNSTLKPELGDTLSLGAVYKPSWLHGFTVSADYFNIDISQAIGTVTAQETADRCAAGDATFCAQIVRDSNGAITTINARAVNFSNALTRGIDFELGYATPALGGDLDLRLFATKMIKATRTIGTTVTRYDGQNNGTLGIPSWTATAMVTYSQGRASGTVQGRFLSAGTFDNTLVEGVDINDNSLPSAFYVNLTAQYFLGPVSEPKKMRIFGTINNLFDKDPPPAPGSVAPVNAAFYDVVGRAYRIGVAVDF
ncbi:MAG: TonB-dependent receptor [Sphingobium sp.]